jgi:hypothetical protein
MKERTTAKDIIRGWMMGHSDPVTLIEKLTVVAAFLIVMLLVSGCATPGTMSPRRRW